MKTILSLKHELPELLAYAFIAGLIQFLSILAQS